ncbi:NAD(P)-dependent dehydrogenase, short-chain alcohol dehydrogenase family [Marinococcus luteus]|uniref:NAD(P)-dependent dehydrogenase, short-chain alcohol dehydrogenase family n=1 Tax=Marinococcus luteus TaxID=1122204 RepID=A0A1H2URP9_9BACI|nr:SDR family oxidoreductase [Marinococcus luteus]SDW58806.1 NAD(P)-dependent dehydrogenase, short-chain alcohol dehydrogenase family [Marinococcus luteus]
MDINKQQLGGQPKQSQSEQPGIESEMKPLPIQPLDYKGSGKLTDRVALITGGDSGIGRAVAIAYAKEGAHVVINYLEEEQSDADETKKLIENEGVEALLLPGDVSEEETCKSLIEKTVNEFGKLDILVNNSAIQFPTSDLQDISLEQWDKTFKTNLYSVFHMTKFAIPHLKEGSSIINTTSINPYTGNPNLIDYTSTKGAINGFTRSMAANLVGKGIRVNMVAPGPIWTPLIPSTFDEDSVAEFGASAPMGRPGQPSELMGPYVLLASDEGSYMTGQCIHVNGGMYTSS